MRLDQAFNSIMEGIKTKLENACAEGELLEGVQTVIRGDRARPKPPTPAVWIFAEVANAEHNPTTIKEVWNLPVVLAVVVKSNTPEEGYLKSSEIAAKARSVILQDRKLGLEYVQDIKSGRYEPSGPWHSEGSLFGAVAVVQVTFLTKEGN